MICGVASIIESIIFGGLKSTLIMTGLIIVYAVVVIVYSYKMYQKYK